MFVIIVLVAVGTLIGSIVKIKKVNAEYLSEAKMDEMARQAAEKATKHITKITCDYCGMVIDITTERVCPHCGATYGNDEEYLNRNSVDEELRDKEYKLAYERAKEQARNANRASYRVVKKFVIFSAVAVVVFLVPMIISLARVNTYNAIADIVSNNADAFDSITSDIEETTDNIGIQDYVFKTTEVLEDENLSVHLGIISKDKWGDYSIPIQVQNKSNEEMSLSFHAYMVNRESASAFFYETIAAGETITKNLEIYTTSWDEETQPIKELIIGGISYYSDSFNIFVTKDDMLRFETTADYVIPEPAVTGYIKYENTETGVTLSTEGTTCESCNFYFTNNGDNDYMIESVSATLNGVEVSGSVWSIPLPAHSQYIVESVGWDFEYESSAPYNYMETFVLTDVNTGNTFTIDNINVVLEDDEA